MTRDQDLKKVNKRKDQFNENKIKTIQNKELLISKKEDL